MNKEDIIRMARECGYWSGQTVEMNDVGLERFAHLVYEATFRDANIAASRTILDAAVLEEREACAKVIETYETASVAHNSPATAMVFKHCAAAIRARSNP